MKMTNVEEVFTRIDNPIVEEITKHIESIGIELECNIPNDEYDDFEAKWNEHANFEKHYDGSINTIRFCTTREYCFWSKSLKDVEKFLKDAYENGHIQTDRSCGFHIHFKFKDMSISKIFSYRDTFKYVISEYVRMVSKKDEEEVTKWMVRLHNHYCNSKYCMTKIKRQLETRRKDWKSRYCAINHNSVYVNKTLEFRLPPYQSSWQEAVKTLKWSINTFENVITNVIDKGYIVQKENMKYRPKKEERLIEKRLIQEKQPIKIKIGVKKKLGGEKL